MKQLLMALLLAISLLIATATSFAGPCGDVNVDNVLNLKDITLLMKFLYRHGPAPSCGPETGTVTDIDGNVYHTIKIGNQWWMIENLKVTHYSNGEDIPKVTDTAEWAALTMGAYCEYDDDIHNVATYGRLYNWFAASDGRNIAPVGWHVPSDAEWQTLSDYLGGDAVAGGKMKDTGTTHWVPPNGGATNESGFAALPGGYRVNINVRTYGHIGYYAYFWSTSGEGIYGFYRLLSFINSENAPNYTSKQLGFSIRCIRD